MVNVPKQKQIKEALLYDKEKNGYVRCKSCFKRCRIASGRTGFCKTRENRDGKLYANFYCIFSAIREEPLGSKPFLHFRNPETGKLFNPNERTLSIGGFGCNLKCMGCQNVEISTIPKNLNEVLIHKKPEEIVREALRRDIKIISFTWNEPAIMPETVFDIAKLAKAEGLFTIYVSNSTPTREYIDLISPFMDGFRYDIKAGPTHGDKFYKNYCGVEENLNIMNHVLDIVRYTKFDKKRHVELLTLLVPTYYPSCIRSVSETAIWIKENLGKETPWHLARFFPANKLNNPALKTPVNMADYLSKFVKGLGLKNAYAVMDKGCDCLKTGAKDRCCL